MPMPPSHADHLRTRLASQHPAWAEVFASPPVAVGSCPLANNNQPAEAVKIPNGDEELIRYRGRYSRAGMTTTTNEMESVR